MKTRILLIEGKRADTPPFLPALKRKGYDVESVPSGKAALNRLPIFQPELIIVNAASLRTNGIRICTALRENLSNVPIVLITTAGATTPDLETVQAILPLPFTARKLLNRISPLIPARVNHTLSAGPIMLDLARGSVQCNQREAQLTPRLVRLLQLFLKNPGKVISRKDLFMAAWQTDYTDDTRTLDVHISWLRRAIEEDPRAPRYIKTVRGLGYRLDIEP